MGWFWGGRGKGDDPTKSLQPDLKEFLDQQQPRPYVPAQAPQPQLDEPVETSRPVPTSSPDAQSVPKESLFQDGRYKHIWATYTPPQEIGVTKSTPADRVVTAKKDRREMIHRAALENCVFEQDLQQNCFSSGDAWNRARATMTMCRAETKAFNRCYQLQAKFLQALGYLSSSQTTNEDEEKIQMHADKLYHRMMDYEAAVDDAKRNDQPIPPLASVFNPSRPAPTVEEINLPASIEKSLKKPLREYPPHERELAARAVLQEAKLADLHADEFFKYTTTLNQARRERQQWLVGALGETVGKFLIPDPPQDHGYKTFDQKELERDFWRDDPLSRAQSSRENAQANKKD